MKISLLSGAYKNAGDFLIVQRVKELINEMIPNVSIVEYERRKSLDEVLENINNTDVILLGGGPAYIKALYPEVMPLTEKLIDIKIPFFAMAMGWYGRDMLPQTIYRYQFSGQTKGFLNKLEADGFSLGCRDWYSEKVLRNSGVNHTIMTGCAAWYDLKYVECSKIRNGGNINKICISDPADKRFYKQFLEVVRYVQNKFPDAEITVVFHRGISADRETSQKSEIAMAVVLEQLKQLGITYIDISYDYKKMNIYQDCDLHIGYRVHAHIYNLSQRHRSVLIEEDGRGAGVNQALGLDSILAYDVLRRKENIYCQKIVNHIPLYRQESKFVCRELDSYLKELEKSNYKQFEWAFERMQYYYGKMVWHLEELKKG